MLLARSMLIAGANLPRWQFNPADKTAATTLSNANRTATGGASLGVAGDRVLTTGKYYFEFLLDTDFNFAEGVGVADPASSLSGPIGNTGGSIGYIGTGEVWYLGPPVATYSPLGVGDVVGVAIDMAANKIWFAKNGVWQSGSPATGIGGISFTASGVRRPFVTATSGQRVTIPYPRRYGVPQGFEAI